METKKEQNPIEKLKDLKNKPSSKKAKTEQVPPTVDEKPVIKEDIQQTTPESVSSQTEETIPESEIITEVSKPDEVPAAEFSPYKEKPTVKEYATGKQFMSFDVPDDIKLPEPNYTPIPGAAATTPSDVAIETGADMSTSETIKDDDVLDGVTNNGGSNKPDGSSDDFGPVRNPSVSQLPDDDKLKAGGLLADEITKAYVEYVPMVFRTIALSPVSERKLTKLQRSGEVDFDIKIQDYSGRQMKIGQAIDELKQKGEQLFQCKEGFKEELDRYLAPTFAKHGIGITEEQKTGAMVFKDLAEKTVQCIMLRGEVSELLDAVKDMTEEIRKQNEPAPAAAPVKQQPIAESPAPQPDNYTAPAVDVIPESQKSRTETAKNIIQDAVIVSETKKPVDEGDMKPA